MTLANQPTNKDISRRDFIAKGAAGAAVGVGASALAGLGPQAVNAQVPRWGTRQRMSLSSVQAPPGSPPLFVPATPEHQ